MWTAFSRWLHAPFATPLNPVGVFFVVGVVLVSMIGWQIILRHVTGAVEGAVT